MMQTFLKKISSSVSTVFSLEDLVRWSDNGLILPFYHSVSDALLPHTKHLYPVLTKREFESDLDFFQTHFQSATLEQLHGVDRSDFVKSPRFYLTFDDGLREFHDVIAPILMERGLPATVFVNTAFVDNKDMFYRMKASVLIERMQVEALDASERLRIEAIFESSQMNFNSARDLLLVGDKNKYLLDEIATVLEVDFSAYLHELQPYLTNQQIQHLIQQGFSIGSHSVSHPYFATLMEAEQIAEVLDSINFISRNFKTKERLFSFPYTDFQVKESFFDAISKEVDLSFGTANLKLDEVANNLQRIPMERWGRSTAKSIVKAEYLSFLLKKVLGKHIIYRA